MYRAKSGFSAEIAREIGRRSGLTPVVVFDAGSGESPNTTNFQSPDPEGAGETEVAGAGGTVAGDEVVHPLVLTAMIRIRKTHSVSYTLAVKKTFDVLSAV
jgi:hypothetical protein